MFVALLVLAQGAHGQTVTAATGLSCAGTRFADTLSCTAGEFTASVTITKGASDPDSCQAGEFITINGGLTLSDSNADRYDIGLFTGETNNDPRANDASKTCSVATFPTAPLPWFPKDANACGDFKAAGVSSPTVNGMRVKCQADPVSGLLTVPYAVVYSQGSTSCSGPSNVNAGSKSKCNAGSSSIAGIYVFPSITVTDGQTYANSGGAAAYVITVSNTSGSAMADLAVSDPAVPGISMTGVSCAASGGATCPATSVAALQGAGLSVASMPNGGVLTFTATATLTGAPDALLVNSASVARLGKSVSSSDSTKIRPSASFSGSPSQAEGSSGSANMAFAVVLSSASTETVSVSYATSNVTAVAGSDYTAVSGTLTFLPGETSKQIQVPILGDSAVEPDETFLMTLSAPVNCSVPSAQVSGTILNDDFAAVGFALTVPSLVSGASSQGSISASVPGFAGTVKNVRFYAVVQNPAGGFGTVSMDAWEGATNVVSGFSAVAGSLAAATSRQVSFNAAGVGVFDLSFDDVGSVLLSAQWQPSYESPVPAGAPASGSVQFVTKPHHFDITSVVCSDSTVNPGAPGAAGAVFCKAGAAFSAQVAAKNAAGGTTRNFGAETVAEGVALTPSLVSPVADSCNAGTGKTTGGAAWCPQVSGAFGAFSNGVASGSSFSWPEVGVVTLTPAVADGDYLGAGAVSGTASGNVGRFYPDRFTVSGSVSNRSAFAAGSGSSFTYMDEPMRVSATVVARGASGAAVKNYEGLFAKLNLLSALDLNGLPAAGSRWFDTGCSGSTECMGFGAADAGGSGTGLSGRLGVVGASAAWPLVSGASVSWSQGVGTVALSLALSRKALASDWPNPPNSLQDGPYDSLSIGAKPRDSDGVTVRAADLSLDSQAGVVLNSNPDSVADRVLLGSTAVRLGRLRLSSAFGSVSPLSLRAEAQYWSGRSWVTNVDDSVSTMGAAAAALPASAVSTPTAGFSVSAPAVLAAGVGTLSVSSAAKGTASVVAAVPVWFSYPWGAGALGGPSAKATIGVYSPETRRTVHIREVR